jgi:hypothetical protein
MEMQATPTTDLPAAGDENFAIAGGGTVGSGGGGVPDTPDAPGAEGIIVDQWGPNFIWSGSQNWNTIRSENAIEGVYITTDNSEMIFRMYGRWNTFLHDAGNYNVYVYVPLYTEAGNVTNSARYRVFHSGTLSDPIVVNQAVVGGEWVLLGTFNFDAGGSQFVYLNDMTGEESGTTHVLFDAVRLTPAD